MVLLDKGHVVAVRRGRTPRDRFADSEQAVNERIDAKIDKDINRTEQPLVWYGRGALQVWILALLFLCYSVPTSVVPYLPVFPVLSLFIASLDYELVIEDFYFG